MYLNIDDFIEKVRLYNKTMFGYWYDAIIWGDFWTKDSIIEKSMIYLLELCKVG